MRHVVWCGVALTHLLATYSICRKDSSERIDPLQHALDRGSTGLDFINSALVLDYLHLKFWNTIPSWMSRNPFQNTINRGFYTYLQDGDVGREASNEDFLFAAGHLLR